jgi:hypothetical protein
MNLGIREYQTYFKETCERFGGISKDVAYIPMCPYILFGNS